MIDNSSRMAQAYGYIVCLIAVVVGLASLAGMVGSLFDYADPVHSDKYGRSGMSVTSYNAYKREYYSRQPAAPRPGPDVTTRPADSLPDVTLRQMYQEDRADHIDNTKFRALRSLVSSLLLLVVSLILFSVHWKWLRRQSVQTA